MYCSLIEAGEISPLAINSNACFIFINALNASYPTTPVLSSIIVDGSIRMLPKTNTSLLSKSNSICSIICSKSVLKDVLALVYIPRIHHAHRHNIVAVFVSNVHINLVWDKEDPTRYIPSFVAVTG